jgi:zinc/manganese transport system substrate-binding protein
MKHLKRVCSLSMMIPTLLVLVLGSTASGSDPDRKLLVVTTLTDYAWAAEEIGGGRLEVHAIAAGNQDAHFVRPRPSYSALMRKADLFVTTGLDLELWVPALLDTAGNRQILEGSPGFVAAWSGVPLKDVPASLSRTEGDVHAYGNPHLHPSPLNMIEISRNILAGLLRVDPTWAEEYRTNTADLVDSLYRRTYGDELVDLLGGETLANLSRNGKLWDFLEKREFPRGSGRTLIDRLGGWLGKAAPLRGRKIITYHKNWIYFTDLLDLKVRGFIEPKPGIPPTPRHVERILRLIKDEDIQVILCASYFDPGKPEAIARKSGARAVIVPLSTGGGMETSTYDLLIDHWIDSLLAGFEEKATGS